MQADIIVDGIHIRLARIDDIIHFSLVHEFQYFVARGETIDGRHFDAEGADGIRRARGGVDIEPEVAELFGKAEYFEFILVVDGEIDADGILFGGMAQFEARRNQPLEERFFDILADAEHFARRFHFGSQLRIHVVQFFKGEHGNFDRHVGRIFVQSRAVAQFFEFGADHDLGGEFHHGHARHFADIRNGTRGAGINFDDVQFVIIDEELNIYKPFRF